MAFQFSKIAPTFHRLLLKIRSLIWFKSSKKFLFWILVCAVALLFYLRIDDGKLDDSDLIPNKVLDEKEHWQSLATLLIDKGPTEQNNHWGFDELEPTSYRRQNGDKDAKKWDPVLVRQNLQHLSDLLTELDSKIAKESHLWRWNTNYADPARILDEPSAPIFPYLIILKHRSLLHDFDGNWDEALKEVRLLFSLSEKFATIADSHSHYLSVIGSSRIAFETVSSLAKKHWNDAAKLNQLSQALETVRYSSEPIVNGIKDSFYRFTIFFRAVRNMELRLDFEDLRKPSGIGDYFNCWVCKANRVSNQLALDARYLIENVDTPVTQTTDIGWFLGSNKVAYFHLLANQRQLQFLLHLRVKELSETVSRSDILISPESFGIEIPIDPFSGEKMKWQVDTKRVYCIGADGIDNAGDLIVATPRYYLDQLDTNTPKENIALTYLSASPDSGMIYPEVAEDFE